MENINDDATVDAKYVAARKKVKVITNPSLPRRSNSALAQVTVRTTDGKEFMGQRMYPLGSPQEPLTSQQVRDLYFKFTRGLLPEKHLKDAASAIANMENLKNISELTDILTC